MVASTGTLREVTGRITDALGPGADTECGRSKHNWEPARGRLSAPHDRGVGCLPAHLPSFTAPATSPRVSEGGGASCPYA
jgi:hypothetical protein